VRLVNRLRVPSHLDRLRLPAIEGGDVVDEKCAPDGAGAVAEHLRLVGRARPRSSRHWNHDQHQTRATHTMDYQHCRYQLVR
jgi:hypothetical protein